MILLIFLSLKLFDKIIIADVEAQAINTLYIPDVQEMELISFFQVKEGHKIERYGHDFMKIDVEIAEKKVRYHFGHNLFVGRCDIFLADHWQMKDLFKIDLKFVIKFSESIAAKETKLAEITVYPKANPNSYDEILSEETENYKFTVKLRLTCDRQFESINCAFKKNESETDIYKRDPYSGKYICKNPETCFASQKCESNDQSPCGKGGQCWKNSQAPGEYYCECFDGFAGKTCNIETPQLTEELMLFAPTNELPNLMDSNDCGGCPSSCQKIDIFTICTSDNLANDAFVCIGECQHVCGDRFCRNKNSDGKILYYLKTLNQNKSE